MIDFPALSAFDTPGRCAAAHRLGGQLLAVTAIVCCAYPGWAAVPSHTLATTNPTMSTLTFGLLAGTLLMACCYLLCIWAVLRDVSQLLLAGMLLLLTIHMLLGHETILGMMGWNGISWLSTVRQFAMIGFLLICAAFTVRFLDLESHWPLLRQGMLIFIVLEGVGLTVAQIMLRDTMNEMLPYIAALNMALLLLMGTLAMVEGIAGSLIHILAFTVFMIGLLATPLRQLAIPNMAPALANNMLYGAAAVAAAIFAAVIVQQFTVQQDIKEQALQQSNERFSLAAQGAHEGLYDWDLRHNTIYFSERLKRIVGYNLTNNLQGLRHLWRLIDRTDRQQLLRQHRAFRRGDRRAMSAEFRIKHPTRGTVWIFATAVAIRAKRSGRILRMVGSLGDITAKKQSDSAMRLSEARFRSITEAHPVPVMIVRLNDGVILYASPGTEPLVYMAATAMIGGSLTRLLGTAAQEILTAIRQMHRVDMFEAKLYQLDGRVTPVAVSGRLIDYQDAPAAVIGLYDLTESKRAEAQIAQQQEALQQSEKMAALGGLLAGVAHELNNPLSVIVGQSTLLRETTTDKKVIERGTKIVTAAERCSRIVKSFLAIARRKPPEHKLMQLNDSVTQALDLLAYPLRTENVSLTLDLSPTLPKIVGDQDQFVQVISNLVLNAAQAMKDWDKTRRVTIRSGIESATGLAVLAVEDTGPGIPADIRARVFEPFFTTKAPGSGTGVGLSLCLSIVSAHGGQLTISDTLGGGATFTIRLPVPDNTLSGLPATSSKQDSRDSAERMPLRILLVDDEFELAQTLADLLASQGHSFDFAINGRIALEKLRNHRFDFILSDLRMPEMDGVAMYQQICSQYPRYKDRIVFITGDTLTAFVRDFLKENPVRFVEKPSTVADVNRAIQEQLLIAEGKSPPITTSVSANH